MADAAQPWRLLFTLLDAGSAALRAGGIPRASVRVRLGDAYAREPHPTDAEIERVWTERRAQNERLYDATKYRLAAVRAADGRCELDLGLTSYREYLGTHTGASHAALVADGARAGDELRHLSCALGVETVLVTADEHMVVLRRSRAVATHAGLYNGPSGHPEPARAAAALAAAPAADGTSSDVQAAAALAELFDSVSLETHEETNVPLSALGEPRLIGAMLDERLKPDLLFCTRTTLDAEQVRDAFRRGAPDAWESSGLVTVPPDGAGGWDVSTLGLELTAVTQAAVECMRVLQRHRGGMAADGASS